MKRVAGIYGILPADVSMEGLRHMAEAALKGGVRVLQLRDKKITGNQRMRRAEALHELAQQYGAIFIINDGIDLALAVGADGVHVGPTDFDALNELRIKLGDRAILGVSCKGDLDFATRMLKQGADYVSFGSAFTTSSKMNTPVIGLKALEMARNRLADANIVAIGGITKENLKAVKQAGADAAAMISGLFDTSDIESRAKMLVESWDQA